MAITAQPPLELPSGLEPAREEPALGVFRRPATTTGWRSWVSTVDHKKIGIMYGAVAMFFFFVGGIEALLVRAQLARPGQDLLSADLYNQLFTMHAVTMIFLFIMPLAAAFANYLLPLQIGARDVAFPRMNALSLWLFVAGGLFMNTSWLLGGGADGGWFSYVPNAGIEFSPSHGIDFFAVGLLIAGIASTVSAVNLTVTVINLRAPGMTLMKMPVFTWMVFVVQLLLVFALPVITVALILLTADRLFGANFFDVSAGADPILWQHLFWIFGHPEVYIIVLPAFGIVSEVIPVFSRKPLFGYPFMVFSGIAIGFMGWGVWAHHMFASGIGPVSVAAFSLATMFIAVPTGVKVLNWLGTMWGGSIEFTVAMKYAVALVAMFTIGGLSGVSHSVAPADTQQTDTYYIVGHFHYVIFGGGVLGFFSGLYFWWPKVFGFKLSEKIGNWNFWLVFIGFNLTFAPMHVLGLQGMSRRIYTYDEGLGFDMWNMVATIGSFVLGVGMLVFVWNVYRSTKRRHEQPPVGPDPWDGRSLEWMIPSPAPEHNFDEVPQVTRLDEFWHRKYDMDDEGHVTRKAAVEDVAQKGDAVGVHLPSPSYWPIALASGMPLIGYGLIFNLWFLVIGALIVLVAILGWALEPSTEPGGHDAHGDDAHADGGGGELVAASGTADPAEAAEVAEAQEIVDKLIEAAALPRRGSEESSNG